MSTDIFGREDPYQLDLSVAQRLIDATDEYMLSVENVMLAERDDGLASDFELFTRDGEQHTLRITNAYQLPSHSYYAFVGLHEDSVNRSSSNKQETTEAPVRFSVSGRIPDDQQDAIDYVSEYAANDYSNKRIAAAIPEFMARYSQIGLPEMMFGMLYMDALLMEHTGAPYFADSYKHDFRHPRLESVDALIDENLLNTKIVRDGNKRYFVIDGVRYRSPDVATAAIFEDLEGNLIEFIKDEPQKWWKKHMVNTPFGAGDQVPVNNFIDD